MKRSRRQRLRARLAILAIVALLWSQFVLASHPAASMSGMAMAAAVPAAMGRGCQHPEPSDAAATVCSAHCSQGDQSSDVGRMPAVSALPPVPALGMAAVVLLTSRTDPHRGPPPAVSWHRPTPHPASLLLI